MLYLGPNQQDDSARSANNTNWQLYYQQQAATASHPLLQQFYGAGMVAAETPISQVPLVAIDFETTGLSAELLPRLAGKVAVVHYRQIERDFLSASVKVRLGENILFPVIDTLELEARLHRVKPLSWWDKLRKRQQVSIRLDASRSRYNLPPYRPHHAVTDAIASAELLQAQICHRFSPDTPVSELWC